MLFILIFVVIAIVCLGALAKDPVASTGAVVFFIMTLGFNVSFLPSLITAVAVTAFFAVAKQIIGSEPTK